MELVPMRGVGTDYKGKKVEEYASKTDDVEAWVVEMRNLTSCSSSSRIPYIFRVPEYIKNMTNSAAYRPWLVSLGPYHHGDPNLEPMEKHKARAVSVMASKVGIDTLISVVEELTVDLYLAYDGMDETRWAADKDGFKKMMLFDGCFLVEIIRVFKLLRIGIDADTLYPKDDLIFSRRGFLSLYLALKSDVILMENQIPLILLEKLGTACGDSGWDHEAERPSTSSDGAKLINDIVLDFLGRTAEGGTENVCLHPLDLLHLSFCNKQEENEKWGDWNDTMPSATELAAAGIQFCWIPTRSVHDIDFQYGVLSMPEIEVNDGTEKEFLNLMAFERLCGCAGRDATAFMIFMDNIIDSESDVALLRSKGIIRNKLSSDMEAAKLFNTLSKGALLSPSNHLYHVRRKVNKHCQKIWNRWRAYFIQTYMRNPIVFSAFVASVLLLIATLLQTVYTIISFHNKKS